jgi:OPA family glycerol-3-phosphate transporter-like MFS transporter 3
MTTTWLAACNSVYLFCYAIGNFISGSLEDRYPLRYLISGALFSSSLCYAVIIFLGFANVYIPGVFVAHWALQGFTQSAVWPGVVAVMGNWFDKSSRGKSMGFWSSCASVGNVIGAQFGNLILIFNGTWMEVMLPFVILQVIVGLAFIFTIRDKPEHIFSPEQIKLVDRNNQNQSSDSVTQDHRKHGIPFMEAVRIPGVIAFSLNYACVKFLYYGLSMWLPYFLDYRIHKPDLVGVLASLLDLGGVLGAVVCGWLGDRLGYKSPIIVIFLTCSLPLLFLFQIGTESIFWLYFIVIPATGFFIAGASNIISSAVAADLAQNPDLQNKDEAMATVTGIVDGTGGIGAAIGVLIMGELSTIDWLYVFLFMIFMGFFSIVCIIHIAYREFKEYRKKNQQF